MSKKLLNEEINKMKSLMNYKLGDNRLNEEEGEEIDVSAAAEIESALAKPISQFVGDFAPIASDPKVQAVLNSGLNDGDTNDDKMTYNQGSITVSQLSPTQNEIGAQESLLNILTDKYGSLASFLDGKANVGPNPIIIFNGKWIIDGHHRWSQVFAANPKAEVPVVNLIPPKSKSSIDKTNPLNILKIVHLSIAAGANKLPLSSAKGENLLELGSDEVYKYVTQNITKKAAAVWKEKRGINRAEQLAKLIVNNVEQMQANNKPPKGAPPRTDMPQTDGGGETSAEVIDRIKSGELNFDNPTDAGE